MFDVSRGDPGDIYFDIVFKILKMKKKYSRNNGSGCVQSEKKVQDLFVVGHNNDNHNVTNSGDRRLTVLKREGSVGIGREVVRRMRATAVAVG